MSDHQWQNIHFSMCNEICQSSTTIRWNKFQGLLRRQSAKHLHKLYRIHTAMVNQALFTPGSLQPIKSIQVTAMTNENLPFGTLV